MNFAIILLLIVESTSRNNKIENVLKKSIKENKVNDILMPNCFIQKPIIKLPITVANKFVKEINEKLLLADILSECLPSKIKCPIMYAPQLKPKIIADNNISK